MSYLAKYKKNDFKKLSWKEYSKTLDILCGKIRRYINKNGIKINAIVPILRAGAFPGIFLSYRFHILRILPLQYHYRFTKNKIELRNILNINSKGLNIPSKPTFLLVEGNHCFGLTASTVAKDLKRAFPNCKIIYAADHIDYSYQKIDNVDKIFYGKLTNETRILSKKDCLKKGIENPLSYLFPWEDMGEEWTTVQGKQFKYEDVKILESGKLKKEISK